MGEIPSLLQELVGSADEALLLTGVDARGGTPVAIGPARADFGNHENIAVTGNDVQFAHAPQVIALEDFETLVSQEVSGDIFRALADELLLGPATRWFARGAALPLPCHLHDLHDLPVF